MKIGIILLMKHCLKTEEANVFSEMIKDLHLFEICCIKNFKSENCYFLEDLLQKCENLTLLDVKKNTHDNRAIKAGARFLVYSSSINFIGYFIVRNENESLNRLLELIQANNSQIQREYLSHLRSGTFNKNIYNKVFPLEDIFLNNNTMSVKK